MKEFRRILKQDGKITRLFSSSTEKFFAPRAAQTLQNLICDLCMNGSRIV